MFLGRFCTHPLFIHSNPGDIGLLPPFRRKATLEGGVYRYWNSLWRYGVRLTTICTFNVVCNVGYLVCSGVVSLVFNTTGTSILRRHNWNFSSLTRWDIAKSAIIGSAIVDLALMLGWMAYFKWRFGHWMGGRYYPAGDSSDDDREPVMQPDTEFWKILIFIESVNLLDVLSVVMLLMKYLCVGVVGSVVYIIALGAGAGGDLLRQEGLKAVLRVAFSIGFGTVIGCMICMGAITVVSTIALIIWLRIEFLVLEPRRRNNPGWR